MTAELAPSAYAAALASMPGATPARLMALLHGRTPAEAWALLREPHRGGAPLPLLLADGPALAELRAGARAVEPEQIGQRCAAAQVHVTHLGAADYPAVLADDGDRPAVLFCRGDLAVLGARCVAVVGTRSATGVGRELAAHLGRELAEAGVAVVSGLARGIDGAAHSGVLRSAGPGAPVGVVASGVDTPYPWEHRGLWAAVAERGVLLSEAPPGTRPDAWRFPLRNRIIATLAEVLIVVESRHRGGSLITAEEALRRGRTVMAVPGSVANQAAEGTNRLLRDGATMAVDTADVLVALGLRATTSPRESAVTRRVPEIGAALWHACTGAPRTLEQLVLHSSSSLGEVCAIVGGLVDAGWLVETGGWYEARDGRR